jgi:GPI ethanolamine phosphate transferase 2/3 subunit F
LITISDIIRPQVYPLTPAWGAIGGYIVGSLWALAVNNVKQLVDLGINARREDEQASKVVKKKKKS